MNIVEKLDLAIKSKEIGTLQRKQVDFIYLLYDPTELDIVPDGISHFFTKVNIFGWI